VKIVITAFLTYNSTIKQFFLELSSILEILLLVFLLASSVFTKPLSILECPRMIIYNAMRCLPWFKGIEASRACWRAYYSSKYSGYLLSINCNL
jgi:hypothetical protein